MIEHRLADGLDGMCIQQYKTDVGFRTLVEGVNENLYIIPKYQRKYRWTKEQVVSLVESLICGLPIPPIYACRNEKNQLEILDGQQRIMSLFFYYIGYYLNKRKTSSINFSELVIGNQSLQEALMSQYHLEELHIQLEGNGRKLVNVDYAALPIEMKRHIDYTGITIIEIKINDERRRAQVLRQIFANLNKGGSLLSPQEQRNGIYACGFYDMLQEFNRCDERWRKIWGQEDAKERDMETLLRLCALRKYVIVKKNSLLGFEFVIQGYHGSYGKLLDRFSEEAMEFDKNQIEEYKDSLKQFFKIFAVGSTQASKVTLLESFYIVYEKMGIHKVITQDIYNSVLGSSGYIDNVRQGTVKMKSMNERWKAVYDIWIGDDK